jgi:DUF1680 family protein
VLIARYFEMDVVAIKAQAHSALTNLRAILLYYELTGEKELFSKAEERFQLYLKMAISENYANFNWFERPEWTEPCAIIDSNILAVQFWRFTGKPVYLETAQQIYYNAIAHAQRSNGGFGCDNCPGPRDNFLTVRTEEAYWCCTGRGGEGLPRAVQYNYFTQGDTLKITDFNNSSATFDVRGIPLTIGQQTNYPFGNKVVLSIDSLKKTTILNLKFFVPSWVQKPIISQNHKPVEFQIKNGFAVVSTLVHASDSIEYSFTMDSGAEGVENVSHTLPGYIRLFFGPLLLGVEGRSEIRLPKKIEIVKNGNDDFIVKGLNCHFSPIYHLMDSKVSQSTGYRKQMLFRQTTE